MGQYLSVGVANEIFVYDIYFDKEKTIKRIDEEFGFDLYEITEETSKGINIKLKEDIFEKEIISLMKEINQFCSETDKKRLNEAIEILQKIENPDYDKFMEVAKRHQMGFQFLEGYKITNNVSYTVSPYAYAYCDIITFINHGKIFMESYYDMFTFLRNNIINNLKSPLKKAIVITMVG